MNHNSIPKVIHYCWFGGNPMPNSSQEYIESWKKFMPDYEIKLWDESNFNVHGIPYTSRAYELGKYAFVSDYARFWILYNFGGLYFDTDVEIIRPIDDIIAKGPFLGCEKKFMPGQSAGKLSVAPGLGIGITPRHPLFAELLEIYSKANFELNDGNRKPLTVVDITTGLLCKNGLENKPGIQCVGGIYIYPKDYFCPQDYFSGKLSITPETRTIHHYSSSWLPLRGRLYKKLRWSLPNWLLKILTGH